MSIPALRAPKWLPRRGSFSTGSCKRRPTETETAFRGGPQATFLASHELGPSATRAGQRVAVAGAGAVATADDRFSAIAIKLGLSTALAKTVTDTALPMYAIGRRCMKKGKLLQASPASERTGQTQDICPVTFSGERSFNLLAALAVSGC
jgi:hypothetical protein